MPPDRRLPRVQLSWTFWRRSIQARVVVSTLLLSAVVVALVGSSCSARSPTASWTRRRPRRSRRRPAAPSTRSAGSPAPAAPTSTPSTQLDQLVRSIVQRGAGAGVRRRADRPGRRVQRGRRRRQRHPQHAGCAQRQHPDRAARRRRVAGGDRGLVDLHGDLLRPVDRQADRARGRHRLPARAARRRRHLHALLPLPDGPRRRNTLSLVRRALFTGGALLLVLVGGADLAGHPAGGDPGPARPPGRGAARLRPARGAHARARRGRHRPARHVVQPDGGQPAEADPPAGGAVRGCSAGSSPTSPTSCAPR